MFCDKKTVFFFFYKISVSYRYRCPVLSNIGISVSGEKYGIGRALLLSLVCMAHGGCCTPRQVLCYLV